MFINHVVGPESVELFRIVRTDQPFQFPDPASEGAKTEKTLEVAGFTDQNEALFKYTNRDQDIIQSFGISIKYYKSQ